MKYRSYNSELLIATTLMCDVFNDIIIDRRKHGLKRDYSKGITLADIVQQKIEVPCIIGERSAILKSLENEPGRYRLPLIIIELKNLKTDTARMCDLHVDVFYQQDSAFSTLEETDEKFRNIELSKKRGQPIELEYNVTFVTKYREDLDQILSNFIVHFRPDIYLKWWHPRTKIKPLTSQLLWSHNVNFDSPSEYNTQNVFVYKGTTTFTFKTWLFYGMIANDNEIDPNLESIIKYIKLFPNKTGEDQADGSNQADTYDGDDTWVFGDIERTDEGTLGFHVVETGQEFTGTDEEKMKNGEYAVNNFFNQNYPVISGDPVISQIKHDPLLSDFFSNYDKYDINNFNKYQAYMLIGAENIKPDGNSIIKNIYFKGSYPKEDFLSEIPSGDYMFKTFFKTQTNSYGQHKDAEFGESFLNTEKINIDYNINDKDFILWADYDSNEYVYSMKSKFNTKKGYTQDFEIKTKPFGDFNEEISYALHKEYDKDLRNIEENNRSETKNVYPINDLTNSYKAELFIDDEDEKKKLIKLRNFIKAHWKSFNLVEKEPAVYNIEIEDSKAGKIAKDKDIYDIQWRSLKMVKQLYEDGNYYQILINKYIYIILKIDEKDEENCDIYDFGILFPLKYRSFKALLYEIKIKESRELLGLNFYLGF